MYQLLRKRLGGKKGFTLIELIVVIAIIAILAVILIPRFAGFTESARQRAVLSEARNILLALEALDAEGELPDAASVQATVESYLGKTLEGSISSPTNTNGLVSFTYSRQFSTSGPTYYATCTNGVLSQTVTTTAPTP